MRHKITILGLFILVNTVVFSQQNDDYKFNYENQFINNPAALSSFNELRVSAYYLQQFTAIEKAPTDMFLTFQTPVPYQRASGGLAVIRESAGLLDNIRINLSGAYKIPNIISKSDYLSIGLGGNYTNFGVNGSDIQLTQVADPFQNIGNERASGINVSVGAFYSSTSSIDYRGRTLEYQVGLSAARAIPQAVNFANFVYRESILFTGFGSLFIPLTDGTYLSPYVDIQYESLGNPDDFSADLVNVNLGLRSIYSNSFILGVAVDNALALGFQAGYRSPNIINGGLVQIIAQAAVPLGQIDRYIDSGFGVSIQYIFDMSNFL